MHRSPTPSPVPALRAVPVVDAATESVRELVRNTCLSVCRQSTQNTGRTKQKQKHLLLFFFFLEMSIFCLHIMHDPLSGALLPRCSSSLSIFFNSFSGVLF
mmetsp:Transcript_21990/g.55204  ORF Transcript_21990/g.55204 Transcript_21990/m.55204 type:complete len:101 (-) Transcript_21990:177-479(-)